MRKNAGVRWARVEEDTRQLTVKCTRITDQRVGWVDRWIQVNRFTRPHVPCISAGCEVKSSGEWSSKCRRGWNFPFSKNLPPFVSSPSTNFFRNWPRYKLFKFYWPPIFLPIFRVILKKKKYQTEINSRTTSERILTELLSLILTVRGKIMDKTTSFFAKERRSETGHESYRESPPFPCF